ncbi:IS21 family transposase [Herbaspirillum aquaticum]|uniref:IS21 family transposase n=1 Tax=Herbaspirillum aquaticum TaxID=568783 RepID=UPI0024DE5C25|nr:IS21 family transposase [Herbaspirillum aquaticum]
MGKKRRANVRTIRDVLKYHFEKRMSQRKIETSTGISRRQVNRLITAYVALNLPWPPPDDWSDDDLEAKLNRKPMGRRSIAAEIDFLYIHEQLKLPGATLQVLYEEWKEELMNDEGKSGLISYQTFCRKYNGWLSKQRLSMRSKAKYGHASYVDYSGSKVPITNKETGEVRHAELFVGVLGGSGYMYAEATWTQTLNDFIKSHVNMFEFFGGSPTTVVPDNLKSAVTRAHIHSPTINDSYQHLCRYYNVMPVPARPRKPKDKPLAEGGVLLAQRSILFCLRKETFFSIEEANNAIRILLDKLNRKNFTKRDGSRFTQWEEHERPLLNPLPAQRYEVALWSRVRAGYDYLVCVDGRRYSVPYELRGEEFESCLTQSSLQLFHKGRSIVRHDRSYTPDDIVILPQHRPPSHSAFSDWSPEDVLRWAAEIGPSVLEQASKMLENVVDRTLGYRRSQMLKSMVKEFGNDVVERACSYALKFGILDTRMLREIINKKLYTLDVSNSPTASIPDINHENIRGSTYYVEVISTKGEHPNDEPSYKGEAN